MSNTLDKKVNFIILFLFRFVGSLLRAAVVWARHATLPWWGRERCVTSPNNGCDRLAQLVERRTSVREVSGSSPDRTNTQGLKITEENMLPLQ